MLQNFLIALPVPIIDFIWFVCSVLESPFIYFLALVSEILFAAILLFRSTGWIAVFVILLLVWVVVPSITVFLELVVMVLPCLQFSLFVDTVGTEGCINDTFAFLLFLLTSRFLFSSTTLFCFWFVPFFLGIIFIRSVFKTSSKLVCSLILPSRWFIN